MRRKMFGMFGLGLIVAVLPLYLGACMFPTTADVNALAKADHDWVADEHEAIRDQMTEEHAIQTPDQAALLAQVNADAATAVHKLRQRVDAVEAKGADLTTFGGMNDWITGLAALLGGGSLWSVVSGLFKPSRATARIDELEKSTTDRIARLELSLATTATARIDELEKSTTDRIARLELSLATAAKAGAPIPSDGPGSPA